jgi:hypothetical protein
MQVVHVKLNPESHGKRSIQEEEEEEEEEEDSFQK